MATSVGDGERVDVDPVYVGGPLVGEDPSSVAGTATRVENVRSADETGSEVVDGGVSDEEVVPHARPYRLPEGPQACADLPEAVDRALDAGCERWAYGFLTSGRGSKSR